MAASEETQDTVAQVGFMAFMAAAMGPVGILVAALAVGAERAFAGEGGAKTSRDLNRQQVADQRQWLAEDRAWRERVRAERQNWFDAGADPTKEPARPSKAEAAGRWWRRLWARMVVFADDFKSGWREGWAAAKKAHDAGAGWRETANTRPEPETKQDEKPEPDSETDADGEDADRGEDRGQGQPEPVVSDNSKGADMTPKAQTPTDPSAESRPTVGGRRPAVGGAVMKRCPQHGFYIGDKCDQCRRQVCPRCGQERTATPWGTMCRCCPRCLSPTLPCRCKKQPTTTEGDQPMTSSNGSAPKGESNATVLREMLRRITSNITKVEAGVDELSALADALATQVEEATEFAARTGQVTATKAATDAANAVVKRLKQLVVAASQAAVEAVDQVAAARGSLKVAESAEDSLTAAGGTGDAVATAKAA